MGMALVFALLLWQILAQWFWFKKTKTKQGGTKGNVKGHQDLTSGNHPYLYNDKFRAIYSTDDIEYFGPTD